MALFTHAKALLWFDEAPHRRCRAAGPDLGVRGVFSAGGDRRLHGSRLLGRDVDAMRTKAAIERAVVDVLRKLGFLEGAPKGTPPLRDCQ
jgi:hypothetical protein